MAQKRRECRSALLSRNNAGQTLQQPWVIRAKPEPAPQMSGELWLKRNSGGCFQALQRFVEALLSLGCLGAALAIFLDDMLRCA